MVGSIAEAKSHNIPPAIVQSYWRKIREAARAKDEASAGLARVKKEAKGAGIELNAIKMIEGYTKLDDDVLTVQLSKAAEYAAILGMPFAKQLSIFGSGEPPEVADKDMEDHKIWEAGDGGLRAGREGFAASANPYPVGSPGFVEWSKEHARGLGERAAAARMDSTESERPADKAAATRRPGRKAKADREHVGALN
jgi:hypothetical protein